MRREGPSLDVAFGFKGEGKGGGDERRGGSSIIRNASLSSGNPIQEGPITRRAVGVTEPVTARIDPMSFAKGLLCHPALIGERSRLVAEEAAYAANGKNSIGGSNSRT